jgi:hypothetical protein
MHDKLIKVVRTLETDYLPYGKVERHGSDCSDGCRHFVKVAGWTGDYWGVCTNPESPRAGLLTFEHQGCTAFEPVSLDLALSDSQLRSLISEATARLRDQRTESIDSAPTVKTPLPNANGQFMYFVRTSYSPLIKGHLPAIFRLEAYDGSFVAVLLLHASRKFGGTKPMVTGHFPARNGDVFKIVRENGDYSYQVPFNGKLHNLKQFGDLSKIGVAGLETLRRFLECAEPEAFEKITQTADARLKSAKRRQHECLDQVNRWHKQEFFRDETPTSERQYRRMLKEAEAEAEWLRARITEEEAFLEWLKGIDRSGPTLRSVPPPPAPRPRLKR